MQFHMAQKPVLRAEVGCACVAREVSARHTSTIQAVFALLELLPHFPGSLLGAETKTAGFDPNGGG